MIPVSGSAYSYSYATLGEGIAWFIGWNLILEYLFAVATVSVGWSGYLISLLDQQFGVHLPAALSNAPFAKGAGDFDIVRTGALINLPAVAIVAALTIICYIGIRQSSAFNTVIVAIKVTDRAAVHPLRCEPHRRGQLAPVHSAEHRHVRPVRLERHHGGLGRDLLRLHRL